MNYVSIVILSKNAGQSFRQTLESIYSQRVPFRFEVIVVDSGSTDDTLHICKEFPLTVLAIHPEDFNHGRTRNYAIHSTKAETIVLIVQDAQPADSQWLYNLVRPLREDSRIAGAYSRQIPRPGADSFTRKMMSMWGVSSNQSFVRQIDDWETYNRLTWEEKVHFCAFSNVSSAIRTSIWQEIPFPDVEYAEDLGWAKSVLEHGYRLAYIPSSVVIHSHHHRPWMEKLQRAYLDGRTVPSLFNARLPLPDDESVNAAASLLRKELENSELFRTPQLASLAGTERARELSPESIAFIASECSPWMPGASEVKKKETLINALAEARASGQRWKERILRAQGLVWIKFLSSSSTDTAVYRFLLRRCPHLLGQMWEPWMLFWGILSTRAGSTLPVELSNQLLSYALQFLPAPAEELADIWLNVLVDTAGKYLGKAAWASTSQGKDCTTLQGIERWITKK
jgi:rhamnosyltransferase